jgi:hypothetical protein
LFKKSSPEPTFKEKCSKPAKIKEFNSSHYRKLIGKLTAQAIAIQRRRSQERKGGKHD